MAVSQLSQLAAIGTFEGFTPAQLTPSRGFGDIVRTTGQPAGSWDIEVDQNVAGAVTESQCVLGAVPVALSPSGISITVEILNDHTIRAQIRDLASGNLTDAPFSIIIHRIN